MRISQRRKFYLRSILVYFAIAVVLCAALFPIVWTISTSFKTEREYFTYPPVWIPRYPTLDNYHYIFFAAGLSFLKNSLIISSFSTLLVLAISIPAAYGIARLKVGGANLSFWILSQRMLPPIAVILPLFLMFKELKLVDTHLGLILVYSTFNISFGVWLLIGFIEEFPKDIEEAAMVDGCSRGGALMRIVLPLIAPGIVVTAIFCFIFSWNEFLFALILTRRVAETVTVELSHYLSSESQMLWGPMAALMIVVTIPILIMALSIQKYLVKGLTFGAIK